MERGESGGLKSTAGGINVRASAGQIRERTHDVVLLLGVLKSEVVDMMGGSVLGPKVYPQSSMRVWLLEASKRCETNFMGGSVGNQKTLSTISMDPPLWYFES